MTAAAGREPVRWAPHEGGAPKRVGLVLAGGGAKGVYQVGVVEYLAAARIPFTAVAGASIGALNAALVATSPDLGVAAARMEQVWAEVGAEASKNSALVEAVRRATKMADAVAKGSAGVRIKAVAAAAGLAGQLFSLGANPVLRPEFLQDVLARHVDVGALRSGMPLWVSVFPAASPEWNPSEAKRLIDDLGRAAGRRTAAEWLHVSSLPDEDVHRALRASSALPLLVPSQQVGERFYRDGGLADNVPAGALLAADACDMLIVTHLNRAALWDRHEYEKADILEIRPSQSLAGAGALGALEGLLDFSPEKAAAMRRQGYEDAEAVITKYARALGAVQTLRDTQVEMRSAVAALDEPF